MKRSLCSLILITECSSYLNCYLLVPFSWQVLGRVGGHCGGIRKWLYWILRKSTYSKWVRNYVSEETFSEIYRLVKKKSSGRNTPVLAGSKFWQNGMKEVEILPTIWSVVWSFGHFPGSWFRWRTWISVFHRAVEFVWIFRFLGRKSDSTSEPLIQHRGSWRHGLAAAQHKDQGSCFSSTKHKPLSISCDFCKSTSLVLRDVFPCY